MAAHVMHLCSGGAGGAHNSARGQIYNHSSRLDNNDGSLVGNWTDMSSSRCGLDHWERRKEQRLSFALRLWPCGTCQPRIGVVARSHTHQTCARRDTETWQQQEDPYRATL